MPGSSTFYDQLYFPWKDGYPEGRKAMDEDLDEAMDKVLWARLAHSPWDHAGEDGFWKQLRSRTKRLREESDKALLVVCGCNSVGDLVGIMALGGNYFFYNIHNIMPTQEDLP